MTTTNIVSIELEPRRLEFDESNHEVRELDNTKTTNSTDSTPTAATSSSPTTPTSSLNASNVTAPSSPANTATTETISSELNNRKANQSTAVELIEEASLNSNIDNNNVNNNNVLNTLHNEPLGSRQLYQHAAAAHGGDDTRSFLNAELSSGQLQNQQQMQPLLQASSSSRLRTPSSTLDASISRHPSTSGRHEKKIGHRRVEESGEVTYKRIQTKQIMGSIQLGIQHTVGSLASKPKRDLLMNDFWEMETISFPSEGSSITPAHHYSDFRFKVYAPIAFRYFRDLFGIAPDDFLMSLCAQPLRELSNPGASGSIFYLTADDEFIIKTVQKKECEFLQKLLPGYYMNLSQNPRTLLPKFFGLYCFHYNTKNVRLVAMNNLLPSEIKMHAKYDLKGSTFRRKASKAERQKASPTYKDLDFMEHHPNGIFLETDKYNALIKTIQRDCMVLESFQIMDYSLLVGIHNLDIAAKEKREERIRNARAKLQKHDDNEDAPSIDGATQITLANQGTSNATAAGTAGAIAGAAALGGAVVAAAAGGTSLGAATGSTALNRSRSMNRQRLVAHSTAMESITADMDAVLEEDEDVPAGGIPARSENDERLILFIGIIDILQSYRLEKKLEHTFKSIIYNGDTVSVCRPSFYAQRFQNFMGKTVFKKTPTFPLKHSPSKRKTSNVSLMQRTPQRTPSQGHANAQHILRPLHLHTGSSTPPPAFDDISEEDITATSTPGIASGSGGHSTNFHGTYNSSRSSSQARSLAPQRSIISSNRSVISSTADDYSETDDDVASNSAGARSPALNRSRSPRLSKTSVQLTTIGCVEDTAHKPENRVILAIKSRDANGDDDDDDENDNDNYTVSSEQHDDHDYYEGKNHYDNIDYSKRQISGNHHQKSRNEIVRAGGMTEIDVTGDGVVVRAEPRDNFPLLDNKRFGDQDGSGLDPAMATTKTTVITAVQQTSYTSTFVFNDLR